MRVPNAQRGYAGPGSVVVPCITRIVGELSGIPMLFRGLLYNPFLGGQIFHNQLLARFEEKFGGHGAVLSARAVIHAAQHRVIIKASVEISSSVSGHVMRGVAHQGAP